MVRNLGMLRSQESQAEEDRKSLEKPTQESQPKKDVQSFYEEKPRCNEAAVEDGKKKLAAYEKRAKEPTAKTTKPDYGKQSWVERLSGRTTQQTEQGRVH